MSSSAPSKPPRGLLLCLEGLDRTGKTTQTGRLQAHLQSATNTEVILQKFPDRTTGIGEIIDRYLRKEIQLDDGAVHLLFSANRWEKRAEILKHLEEGRHVLLDRYILSGIAFSVAKGLDFDWCRAPDVGLPWPDVTIVLELDAEEQEKRGGYGGERYEVPKLQAEVKRVFGQLGGTKVDAKGSVDEVERRIWAVVEEALKNRQEEVGVFH